MKSDINNFDLPSLTTYLLNQQNPQYHCWGLDKYV